MGGGAEFGVCKEANMEDCFAYVSGRCRVLNNCEFHGKKCPFFKERRKSNGRKENRSSKNE